MPSARTLQDRVLDGVLICHLLFIFVVGYDAAARVNASNDLALAAMLAIGPLICIGGALYPFRLAARILWIVATPLFVMVTLLLGMEVRMRTASTLAYRPAPFAISQSFLALSAAYLPLPFWLFRRREGWSLAQRPETSSGHQNRRSLSLRDLLVIVGLFAMALVLCRQVLTKEMIKESMLMVRAVVLYRWPAIMAHTIVGTMAVWCLVWLPQRWTIPVALVWFAVAVAAERMGSFLAYGIPWTSPQPQSWLPRGAYGQPTIRVASDLASTFYQQGSVCLLIVCSTAVFRFLGFRLQHEQRENAP